MALNYLLIIIMIIFATIVTFKLKRIVKSFWDTCTRRITLIILASFISVIFKITAECIWLSYFVERNKPKPS